MDKEVTALVKTCEQFIEEIKSFNSNSEFNDIIKCLSKAEKISIETRKYAINFVKNEDDDRKLSYTIINQNSIDITMFENGTLSIIMPLILPFSKIKKLKINSSVSHYSNLNTRNEPIDAEGCVRKLKLDELYIKLNSILEPLKCSLDLFFDGRCIDENIKKYNNSTFVFTNHMPKVASKMFPDPDNYEYKQIIDTVTKILNLNSDNGIRILIQNRESNETYTELNIYPGNFDICFIPK